MDLGTFQPTHAIISSTATMRHGRVISLSRYVSNTFSKFTLLPPLCNVTILTLSLAAHRWVGGSTDIYSNSNISRTAFKLYSIGFLMISRLIDFELLFSGYCCLTFVELLKSQGFGKMLL